MTFSVADNSPVNPTIIDLLAGTITYELGGVVKTIPIVEGRPCHDGLGLRCKCPYCGRNHFHGPAGSTRLAECGNGEYYLQPRGSTFAFAAYGEVESELTEGCRP